MQYLKNVNLQKLSATLLLAFALSFLGAGALPVNAATNATTLKPCKIKITKKTTNKTPKTVTIAQAVAFAATQQNDATLAQGQTKVIQTGQTGSQALTYKAGYKHQKLTSCKLSQTKTTKTPVAQVTAVGTYVAPAPTPAPAPVATPTPSYSSGSYTNVDGNSVASPNADAAGASAQCRDGSYSHSLHRSGTCSGHGGVATWL